LQQSAATFSQTHQDLDASASKLNAAYQGLMWDGQAGPVFKAAVDEWNKDARIIHVHLTEMADLMNKGAAGQEATEAQNLQQGHF